MGLLVYDTSVQLLLMTCLVHAMSHPCLLMSYPCFSIILGTSFVSLLTKHILYHDKSLLLGEPPIARTLPRTGICAAEASQHWPSPRAPSQEKLPPHQLTAGPHRVSSAAPRQRGILLHQRR